VWSYLGSCVWVFNPRVTLLHLCLIVFHIGVPMSCFGGFLAWRVLDHTSMRFPVMFVDLLLLILCKKN
jgi:hypothetical protein